MTFILKHDLLTRIKAPELAILTEDTTNPNEELETSIAAAESELKSYITHRHDVAVVMPPLWYFDPTLPRAIDDVVLVYSDSEYSATTNYDLNTIIVYEGVVYRSDANGNLGNTPDDGAPWVEIGPNYNFFQSLVDDNDADTTDAASWTALDADPRDALLRRLLIDLTLYDLHARIKPRQIPEHRIQLRDDAIKFLRDSADPRKNVTLNLPLTDHGENSGVDMTFGGNDKITHSY